MSGTHFAPGETYFQGQKTSFVDVPIDAAGGIGTSAFLSATESLIGLFDILGSVAFAPVKSDLTGNVKKIRDRETAAPAESATLQELVKNELKTKKHTASEGLLWLVRGLDFTAQALRHNIDNSSEELSASFREAYGGTLKPHHGMLVRPVFNMALSATPYRKDFYAKLGDDQDKVKVELEKWLSALEKQVTSLKAFQATKEAKW